MLANNLAVEHENAAVCPTAEVIHLSATHFIPLNKNGRSVLGKGD
jgi:hypothetical protein